MTTVIRRNLATALTAGAAGLFLLTGCAGSTAETETAGASATETATASPSADPSPGTGAGAGSDPDASTDSGADPSAVIRDGFPVALPNGLFTALFVEFPVQIIVFFLRPFSRQRGHERNTVEGSGCFRTGQFGKRRQ